MRTQFAVWTKEHKVRYYDDLSEVQSDFTAKELEGANIQVLLNGTVVGHLNTENTINEIFSHSEYSYTRVHVLPSRFPNE